MNFNLDTIMANHHITHSESSEDLSYLYQNDIEKKQSHTQTQKGGLMSRVEQLSDDFSKLTDKPSGGFPPIYILTQKDKNIDKDPSKNRQIAARKTAISIRDILKSKK